MKKFSAQERSSSKHYDKAPPAVRVTYKDNSVDTAHHPDEFVVLAHAGMVEKWRKDKSIPLIQVVESFDIFTSSSGGKTGILNRPSRQSLENCFGTSKEDEILSKILTVGIVQNVSSH